MSKDREVMDIVEAAEFLGVSRDTMYRYADTKFVPAFKMGNRWKFLRSSLIEWCKKQEGKRDE